MQNENQYEKNLKYSSSSPRFSCTFNKLFNRFSDLSKESTLKMASRRNSLQNTSWDEQGPYKPVQWKSTVSSPSCALCNKSVFPAEEVIAAGQKFHKLCLKCTSCNTLLNSGNINEHDKKIFCVGCYRRQFGPHGIRQSLGSTLQKNFETPPISPNLNQNDDSIKTDEENCQQQNLLNSSQSPPTSFDEDLRFNNSSMNSVTYIGGVSTKPTNSTVHRASLPNITNGLAFKMMSISGNICPRCSKSVYSAEEVKAAGKSFHKRCYTCANCKKGINAAQYSEHEGDLYDNNCYQRLFGPKGIGSGTTSTED